MGDWGYESEKQPDLKDFTCCWEAIHSMVTPNCWLQHGKMNFFHGWWYRETCNYQELIVSCERENVTWDPSSLASVKRLDFSLESAFGRVWGGKSNEGQNAVFGKYHKNFCLLCHWFWDRQSVQVHKLTQLTQLVHIPRREDHLLCACAER